jgi:hypothetical protein
MTTTKDNKNEARGSMAAQKVIKNAKGKGRGDFRLVDSQISKASKPGRFTYFWDSSNACPLGRQEPSDQSVCAVMGYRVKLCAIHGQPTLPCGAYPLGENIYFGGPSFAVLLVRGF